MYSNQSSLEIVKIFDKFSYTMILNLNTFVEQVATSEPDWFMEMKETSCWWTWQIISVAALSGALVDNKSCTDKEINHMYMYIRTT